MRGSIIFLFLLGIAGLSHAQSSDTYNIIYELNYRYSKNSEKTAKAYFNLVGNGSVSVFENQTNYKRDSILATITKLTMADRERVPISQFKFSTIKKGDSIIHQEDILINSYRYKELIEFNWQIKKGSYRKIKNFDCQLATLSYGGREWNAWFTLEIPISDGPFKFSGLPGLIVKIYDDTKHYDFEVYNYKLKSKLDLSSRMINKKAENTTRENFLKMRTNAYSNFAAMNNLLGVSSSQSPDIDRDLNQKLRNKRFIETQ
jgi:GLPGLI family protein